LSKVVGLQGESPPGGTTILRAENRPKEKQSNANTCSRKQRIATGLVAATVTAGSHGARPRLGASKRHRTAQGSLRYRFFLGSASAVCGLPLSVAGRGIFDMPSVCSSWSSWVSSDEVELTPKQIGQERAIFDAPRLGHRRKPVSFDCLSGGTSNTTTPSAPLSGFPHGDGSA